jgi:hypothetical protein
MGRTSSILRCKCIRCATQRRKRFFDFLFICIALAVGSKLLVEEHHSYFRAAATSSSIPVAGKIAHGEFEFSAGDRLPETIASSSLANSYRSAAKTPLAVPRVSRERFNAALAAGLIDPSRIELSESPIPKLSLPGEVTMSPTWMPVMIPMTGQGKELQVSFLKFAAAAPMATAPSDLPKAKDAVQRLAPAINEIVFSSPNQVAKAEPAGTALRRPAVLRPTNKQSPVKFISKAGISPAEISSSEENRSRRNPPAAGANRVSPSARKAGDHQSQSRELTENLQRFASDFVRANQDDNFAEQHRFFADSVHFYGEGDLSLAGVEAATRRYRRQQQPKRSEVAEPAAATGPVNGGFFVIEQPVRWTQSQGTKVKQGRSVLRLRVVPINHGGWKITSIDEVGK